MVTMHTITPAAILFFLLPSASAASCSSFTPSQDPYSQPASNTFIISKGVTCDSTTDVCRVPIGGYVTDGRTLNITTDSEDSIYQRIADTVGFSFNESKTTWWGSSNFSEPDTWPIQNGTSGYVGWTAIHRCTAGQLSDCDASTLEGVYVEACTPFPPSGDVEFSGTTAAITTDRSTAEALTCNPANTTAAQNGNYSISCSTADSQPEEGAASGLGGVSLVMLSASLLVGFVGI
ncbi:hypothetical protein D6D01_00873 [Aureobasidium pullulans]|uniref:Uncharacterized protein n=1 Tax=Aureobasidium pullulans TaxID=5580 RepID=A0A4V4JY51_AURPU|nr:hypothetical protein D6D01_00873 [Aureobasidium pullulans]